MKGSRKRFSKRYRLCSRVCQCVFAAQIVVMQVFVLGRPRAPKRNRSSDGTQLHLVRRTFMRLYFHES